MTPIWPHVFHFIYAILPPRRSHDSLITNISQTQGLLQQARRDANRVGQLGGDRQAILEGNVISNYLQRAGDISAGIYSDAYNQALDAQTRAIGLAPQTLASLQVPAQQLAQVGAVQQARAQQAIDDQRARFEFAQMEPSNRLTRYANIAGTNILPGTTTSSAIVKCLSKYLFEIPL